MSNKTILAPLKTTEGPNRVPGAPFSFLSPRILPFSAGDSTSSVQTLDPADGPFTRQALSVQRDRMLNDG